MCVCVFVSSANVLYSDIKNKDESEVLKKHENVSSYQRNELISTNLSMNLFHSFHFYRYFLQSLFHVYI